MNNEDAVKTLKAFMECMVTDCDYECERCHIQADMVTDVLEACAVAITELSQIDTDTVSRQAVIDTLIAEGRNVDSRYLESERIIHESDAVEAISMLPPSPTQSRPKGHWIRWYETLEDANCVEHIPKCKCSECGKEYDPHSSQFINFCQKCGADMRQQRGGMSND